MSGRTRAPARVKASPADGGALLQAEIDQVIAEGGRLALTSRGARLLGPFLHELPRDDVALALRERVLEDPAAVIDQRGGAGV